MTNAELQNYSKICFPWQATSSSPLISIGLRKIRIQKIGIHQIWIWPLFTECIKEAVFCPIYLYTSPTIISWWHLTSAISNTLHRSSILILLSIITCAWKRRTCTHRSSVNNIFTFSSIAPTERYCPILANNIECLLAFPSCLFQVVRSPWQI